MTKEQLYLKPICELPKPIPSVDSIAERLYEAFGGDLNCCKDKSPEHRLQCFEGKFKEFLAEQALSHHLEIENRNNLISSLETQKEEMNKINAIQDKLIKNLTKSADHKQAVIDEQKKTIKQLKQRISKADKQSTKNHNLKMHTQTLKSKVSQLQEGLSIFAISSKMLRISK